LRAFFEGGAALRSAEKSGDGFSTGGNEENEGTKTSGDWHPAPPSYFLFNPKDRIRAQVN